MFAALGAAGDAAAYLTGQDHSHTGAVVTAWTSGHPNETGNAVFYAAKGNSTIVWSYRGSRFVGKASASSLQALEAWWTATGRAVVGGAVP